MERKFHAKISYLQFKKIHFLKRYISNTIQSACQAFFLMAFCRQRTGWDISERRANPATKPEPYNGKQPAVRLPSGSAESVLPMLFRNMLNSMKISVPEFRLGNGNLGLSLTVRSAVLFNPVTGVFRR